MALREIGAGIDRYRRAVAVRGGLAAVDVATVGLLHRDEPLRAAQIGEYTGLAPASVTALLDRLETRGFLSRTRPGGNRRSLEVRLTPAGHALGDALVDGVIPALTDIVDNIGPEACQALVAVLERFAGALAVLAQDPDIPAHVLYPDR